MTLRNPVYLDLETLEALAQYHEVDFPLPADVVERTTQGRSAEAGAKFGPFNAAGKGGTDVELQRSYSLTPRHKTVVSRTLDDLIRKNHVRTDVSSGVSRDELVLFEGNSSLMPSSTMGKLMHIALLALKDTEGADISQLNAQELEPGFMQHAKRAFLDNDLLPIPLLLRLQTPADWPSVYVNLEPGNFLESRSIDDVEGEIRVFGTVDKIIDEGDFYSAEKWLLPGWERDMRRVLMTTDIEQFFHSTASLFDVEVPEEDTKPYLSGPALLITAIAAY